MKPQFPRLLLRINELVDLNQFARALSVLLTTYSIAIAFDVIRIVGDAVPNTYSASLDQPVYIATGLVGLSALIASASQLKALHVLLPAFLCAHAIACFIQASIGGNLSWAMLDQIPYIGNVGPAQTFQIISDYFSYSILIAFTIWLALAGWQIVRMQSFGLATITPQRQSAIAFVAAIILYVGQCILVPTTIDPLHSIISSFVQRDRTTMAPRQFKGNVGGIYSPDGLRPTNQVTKRRSVIIVIVESLNSFVLNAADPQGSDIAPFLKELSTASIFQGKAYANSTYTTHGHFILFTSCLPPYRGAQLDILSRYSGPAWPKRFREIGYQTTFLQGHSDLAFNKSLTILTRLGFSEVATPSMEDRELDTGLSNWGVGDGVLYNRSLEWIDNHLAHSAEQPFLLAISTIQSHSPFINRGEATQHFPRANSSFQHYCNTISEVDRQLSHFVAGLKSRGVLTNTVLCITADHAYPVGLQGSYKNTIGANEENFRIPLLVIDQLAPDPMPVSTSYASQLDILPTVYELATGQELFINLGQSLSKRTDGDVIPILQPYDGTYLILIRNKLKYKYNISRRREDITETSPVNDFRETPVNGGGRGQLMEFRSARMVFSDVQHYLEGQ